MVQSRQKTIAPLDSLRAIIKERRNELTLTQEQLAALSGYDRTYINMVERGGRNPSFTAILAICSALRIRPSSIVRRVEKESEFEFISEEQLAVGLLKKKRIARLRK